MDSISHGTIPNERGQPRGRAQDCWTSSLAATQWGIWVLAAGSRIIQESGPVLMCYCHAHQDRVHFILTNVNLPVDGGSELIMADPGDMQPALNTGF